MRFNGLQHWLSVGHLAHGGERRVAGCIQILNQQLDTVWNHAMEGQKRTAHINRNASQFVESAVVDHKKKTKKTNALVRAERIHLPSQINSLHQDFVHFLF